MQDWKMAQLKAHQQFTLGRIDGMRWVLDRTDCLKEEDNEGEKIDIQDRIRDCEATDRELSRLIQNIMDARESEKQGRLDEQAKTHKRFTDEQNN